MIKSIKSFNLILLILVILTLSYLFSGENFINNINLLDDINFEKFGFEKLFYDIPVESPFYDDNILLKGKVLFEQGKYNETIKYFKSILQTTDFKDEKIKDVINYFTGLSYFKINNVGQSKKYLNSIQKLNYVKFTSLALLSFNANNYNLSKQYINKFLRLNRNNRYLKFYLLNYFLDILIDYTNNNYASVIKKYQIYLNDIRADKKIWINAFKIFFQSCLKEKKHELILEELKKLENLDSDYIKYCKGFLNLKNLNFDKAESFFLEIEKNKNADKSLINLGYFRLAQIYFLKDNFEAAIKNFNKIQTNNINLKSEKYSALGYIYYKINDIKKSSYYFDKIKLHQENFYYNFYYYQKYLMDKTKIFFESNKYVEIVNIYENVNFKIIENSIFKEIIYYYFVSLRKLKLYKKIIDIYESNEDLNYPPNSYYEISLAYENSGKYRKALYVLNNILNKIEEDSLIDIFKEKIADYYSILDEKITALKMYDGLPETNSILLKKAYLYFDLKQYNICLDIIKRLEKANNTEVYFKTKLLHNKILLEMNRFDEANIILNELLDSENKIEFCYNLLYSNFKTGDLEKFAGLFHQYREDFVDLDSYKDILYLYAELLVKNKKYYEAIKVFKEIETNFIEESYNTKLNAANCYRGNDMILKSKEILEDIIIVEDLTPEQLEEVDYNLALNYFKLNEHDEAYEHLKRIKKYFVDYKILALGDVNFELKNNVTAEKYYYQIINEFKNSKIYDAALYRLTLMNIKAQKLRLPEKYLKKIVEEYKESQFYSKALFLLGYIYFQQNEFEDSLKYLRPLLNVKQIKFEVEVLNLLSKVYYNFYDFKSALEINEKLIDKVDDFYKEEILFLNSKIHCFLGEFETGIQILNELSDYNPLKQNIFNMWLANMYLFNKDYSNCKKIISDVEEEESINYRLLKFDVDFFTGEKLKYFDVEGIKFDTLDYLDKLRYLFFKGMNFYNEDNMKNANEQFEKLTKFDRTKLFTERLKNIKIK